MLIFGGFSHKHNEVEACYDDSIYFFHLGCQTWVSNRILEYSPQGRGYPKNQGILGHASAVRKKNMLIISGGFHGSLSGDVLAYTFPYPLAMKRNDKVCSHYGSQNSCSSNPECGWCPSDGKCYLRTSTSKCASNLQTVKCPGICPGLMDCQSCTQHGLHESSKSESTVIDELRLNHCSWCSHLQECLPRFGNPDLCTLPLKKSWWSPKLVKINDESECAVKDFSPGITLLKYYNPPDMKYPDEVMITNETAATFNPVNPQGVLEINKEGKNQFISRFLGSIKVPNGPDRDSDEVYDSDVLKICGDFASLSFRASLSRTGPLELIMNMSWVQSAGRDSLHLCRNQLTWIDKSPIRLIPGSNIRIDLIAERNSTFPQSLPGKRQVNFCHFQFHKFFSDFRKTIENVT